MTGIGRVGRKSQTVLKLSAGAAIEIYEGAVRSSKTITSLLSFADLCAHGPAGEMAIVGRTERTAYRNVIRPLQQMLGARRVHYNRGTGQVTIRGRMVWVIGASNELAVDKIQGLTLAGLYIDEAATMPESFWLMATTRLSVRGAKLIATCNPAGANHWLKTGWLDHAALWVHADGTVTRQPQHTAMRVHRYTFVLDDNPYLPPEFVARLRASYTGVWYRRFILSEWTNAEGAVFDTFDPARHVVPWHLMPPMHRLPAAGLDYGTQAASAAGALGWGTDERLYIVDEWRHDAQAGDPVWTDSQISRAVIAWYTRGHTPHHGIGGPDAEPPVEWLYVDPSAASMKVQLFADGFNRAANADNDVVSGLRLISSLLNLDRLRIADRCTALITEIPGYVWDPKAAARGEDKPLKQNDHSIDGALRYPIASSRNVWGSTLMGAHARPTQ